MSLGDPTVDAAMAEEHFKSLSASRKGKLGACTRRINENKLLLGPGGNVEEVNEGAALLGRSLDEFVGVHKSVQMLLSE